MLSEASQYQKDLGVTKAIVKKIGIESNLSNNTISQAVEAIDFQAEISPGSTRVFELGTARVRFRPAEYGRAITVFDSIARPNGVELKNHYRVVKELEDRLPRRESKLEVRREQTLDKQASDEITFRPQFLIPAIVCGYYAWQAIKEKDYASAYFWGSTAIANLVGVFVPIEDD